MHTSKVYMLRMNVMPKTLLVWINDGGIIICSDPLPFATFYGLA